MLTRADGHEGPIWVETQTIATLIVEPRVVFGEEPANDQRTHITFSGGWGCIVAETPEQIDAIEAAAKKAVQP